jgi:hypothetical protein
MCISESKSLNPSLAIFASLVLESVVLDGVDQIMLVTQTETIPHERALRSIEMFGKHVIPACRVRAKAKPIPAAVVTSP